jgi:hypothetical protein
MLIDIGKASELTKGTPVGFVIELGAPPFNKLYLG